MTRRRWIADTWNESSATLTGDQAVHLARVLRAEPGQVFDVLAGGFLRQATVTSVSEREVVFALGAELETDAALPVHLLLAIIKFDHYEWGIEKLTELGAARITPVIARRTEKHLGLAAAKRIERWRKIAFEAAQQSRRSDLLDIDPPQSLKAALSLVATSHKFVLAETEEENTLAAALARRENTGPTAVQHAEPNAGPDAERNRALSLAIGPEGGWSPEEFTLFEAGGWEKVTVGPRILRAETAAITGLAICSALL